MPYDPRKISEGGNSGIDEEFPRVAPKGQFRVIGVDTFDGGDWHEGDFPDLQTTKEHIKVKTEGKQMLKMYIYNDKGDFVGQAGSF